MTIEGTSLGNTVSNNPPSSRDTVRASAGPKWVYPRTGGGTAPMAIDRHNCMGLFPHGRGNHLHVAPRKYVLGSIPARAGEPPRRPLCERPRQVYPRTGGGTAPNPSELVAYRGLSPHGRGNQSPDVVGGWVLWSIPARAGEPPAYSKSGHTYTVYPRTGGGTGGMFGGSRCGVGLSPHGRGNRPWSCGSTAPLRSIPARAGEPTLGLLRGSVVEVYPRTGGGTLDTV